MQKHDVKSAKMLSVVITTWNEAENLPIAVKSILGLADEIVVVDTESTDDTVAVAKKLGCKVFTHKNTGIVEPVRNFSISCARGDWILLLDADEEVPAGLSRKIRQVTGADQADYYRLPRQNIIFGKFIRSEHWWPDYVYRLFKKGFVVWSDAIHSVPMTRGRGADFSPDAAAAIVHHHYQSISQYLQRIDRYTDHQLKLLQKENIRFSWDLLISRPFQEFIRQYFARGGYGDGVHGLALSGLQAFSELVLMLKLWQASGFTEKSLALGRVQQVVSAQQRQYFWWFYEKLSGEKSFMLRPLIRLKRKINSLWL